VKLKLLVLTAACAMFSASIASAHHSFAGTYVEDKTVTIEGKVVEFNVRNPHSFVSVEVTDKDGKTTRWGIEWGGITQLNQSGVNRFTLKFGDKVRIVGAPGRDPEDHRLLLRNIVRPSDGWSWGGRVQ
jgi:hypothetical protein